MFQQKSLPVQSNASHILDGSSSSSEEIIQQQNVQIMRPAAIHPILGYPHKPIPSFPSTKSYPLGNFHLKEGLLERPSPHHDQIVPRTLRTPTEKNQNISIPQAQTTGHRQCNCKRSNCLKLYCECFASGEYCGNCNCSGCYNNMENESSRAAAIKSILERNPTAFRPKIASTWALPTSPTFQENEAPMSSKHNKVFLTKRKK